MARVLMDLHAKRAAEREISLKVPDYGTMWMMG
jgi:hypothetical protein